MEKLVKLTKKDIDNVIMSVLNENMEDTDPPYDIVNSSDLIGRDWNIRDIKQRKKGKLPYKREKNGYLHPVEKYSQSESNLIYYMTEDHARNINELASTIYSVIKDYKYRLNLWSDRKIDNKEVLKF